MMKTIKKISLSAQAALMVGFLTFSVEAQATGTTANNFGDIARNINNSIEELPGLVSSLCYLMGILLGVLGILKVKDHVENPSNTPMREGAIRLAAGGALFALPIVLEAMSNTIGFTNNDVTSPELNRADFGLVP